VIDGATSAAFTAPTILATVCFVIAVAACGYIIWQRWKLKKDAGI
jgi:hypothetical protein